MGKLPSKKFPLPICHVKKKKKKNPSPLFTKLNEQKEGTVISKPNPRSSLDGSFRWTGHPPVRFAVVYACNHSSPQGSFFVGNHNFPQGSFLDEAPKPFKEHGIFALLQTAHTKTPIIRQVDTTTPRMKRQRSSAPFNQATTRLRGSSLPRDIPRHSFHIIYHHNRDLKIEKL